MAGTNQKAKFLLVSDGLHAKLKAIANKERRQLRGLVEEILSEFLKRRTAA